MDVLVFDTETTGLPNFKIPSDNPSQPHICQLAALLIGQDEDGKWQTLREMNRLILPTDWTIPDEVAALHGISTDRATAEGIPIAAAMNEFFDLLDRAGMRVSHNLTFDDRLLRIELLRLGWSRDQIDDWKTWTKTCCTMRLSSAIMKMEPREKMVAAGFHNKNNPPKLTEAFRFFFGRDIEGAHDAMVDTRATANIFTKLVKEGHIAL